MQYIIVTYRFDCSFSSDAILLFANMTTTGMARLDTTVAVL